MDNHPWLSNSLVLKALGKHYGLFLEREQAEKIREAVRKWLGSLEDDETVDLVLDAQYRVGLENPTSLLVLLWSPDGEQSDWAELARQMDVHRSTVTREWWPKALACFIMHFLDIMEAYLDQHNQKHLWLEIQQLFAKKEEVGD